MNDSTTRPAAMRAAVPAVFATVLLLSTMLSFHVENRATATAAEAAQSSGAVILLDGNSADAPEGTVDQRPARPAQPVEFAPSAPDEWSTVFSENFESTSWPTGTVWSVFDDDGTTGGEYYWANRCSGRASVRSAWAVGGGASGSGLACGATYPCCNESWMIAGPFDLSDATDAEMYFEFWVNSECVGTDCTGGGDFLRIWASSDGETWGGIRIAGGWITDPEADPDGWLSYTHAMDEFAGESRVWIAYLFDADDTVQHPGGAKVDNIELRADRCPRTAHVSNVGFDRTCYVPDSTAGVLVDVGTVLPSQPVTVTVSLWYTPDIRISSASRALIAPGSTVIELEIPTEAFPGEPLEPGDYTVTIWVLDAATGCWQEEITRSIRIDPECGTETPGTPEPTSTPDLSATPCPGQSVHETKVIHIPPAPARADVLFAFDTTGSMGPVLDSAKTNAVRIMNDLTLVIPNIQFGVVDFRDYPIAPYGDSGDWPYLLRQPITNNRAAVESAIGLTSPAGGNDGPEAYTRAIYESYTDSSVGWRPEARRFVVMFGDNVPHDDNLNARVSSPPVNPGGTWCADATPCVLDPGRDGVPGTADDLDFQSVLDAMRDRKITLLFVVSGSGTWRDTTSAYWKQWASWTNLGGDAVALDVAGDLPSVIRDLMSAAGRRIARIALETDPPSYQRWLTVNPPAYTDLTIPVGGRAVSFDVTITVPPETPLGSSHRFRVKAIGDGAVYGEQSVAIDVPRTCPTGTVTRTPGTPIPPTHTPEPTPVVCPTPRPPATLMCHGPNVIRNRWFELAGRSWGMAGNPTGDVISRSAIEGFYSASFDGPAWGTTDVRLFQFIDMPETIDAMSFDVERIARRISTLSPAPPTGRDYFRVSLYDPLLGTELVRLWEVNPLLPEECPLDSPTYNLTASERALVAGSRVVLVMRLFKETRGWTTNITLDGIVLNVCTSGPPCRIAGDKAAHPGTVPPRGEVAVTLSLTGFDGTCLPSRRAADVMLVLDRSGSMEGRPIVDLRAAAKRFLDRLDPTTDQAGLVSFADSPILNQRLNAWPGAIRAEIDALMPAGNTNIADAILTAQAELESARHRPGSQPVIVLMSDGQPNLGGDPVVAAAAAKAAGSRIFTIGLGSEVDPDLMRSIASAPSDAFIALSSVDLISIYERIAGVIGGAPATNITVVDVISPDATLIPGSFFGAPAPQVSADGKTLTWTFPRIGIETIRWGYLVRMTDRAGTWPTNEIATATYTNSQGNPGSLVFPIPRVHVLPADEGHPELVCRDHSHDFGSVPSNRNGEVWWDSPDIWVRNMPDGVPEHQNPITGSENTVYVRVRNVGDAEARDVTVIVYDSPGATSIRWPDDWVPAIGQATIARIGPGATVVVAIPWTPTADGHTCFLARIQSATDPIMHDGWVPFDSNICQRNVKVVAGSGASGAGVRSGNRFIGPDYGSIRVRSDRLPDAPATGRIIFPDEGLFGRWRAAGGTVSGGTILEDERAVEFSLDGRTGPGMLDVRIERIPFEGEEVGEFALEIDGLGSAEPPEISIEQWAGDRAIGGVVVRPPRAPMIYLPNVKKE